MQTGESAPPLSDGHPSTVSVLPPQANTGHNAGFNNPSLVLLRLKAGQAILGIPVGMTVGTLVGARVVGNVMVMINVPLHLPDAHPCPSLYVWQAALRVTVSCEHFDPCPQPSSFWSIVRPDCPINWTKVSPVHLAPRTLGQLVAVIVVPGHAGGTLQTTKLDAGALADGPGAVVDGPGAVVEYGLQAILRIAGTGVGTV